jgi:hypothetical protein
VTRLLWFFAWAGVAVWSLFSFSAYGLVDLLGGLIARNADALARDPGTVEWLFWFLNGLKNLGLTAILIVWGLVSLAILAVPWFFDRLLGRAAAPQPPRDPHVIDLTPDQYRRFETPPAGPPRPGPLPRIEPRR